MLQTISPLSTQTIVSHDFRMPKNLRFGVGAFNELPKVLEDLKAQKVAIISDKGLEKAGLVDKTIQLCKTLPIETISFSDLAGEPTFTLLENVYWQMRKENCDTVIGIGGGSALDVAKTVAALLGKDEIQPYLSGQQTIESRTISLILIPTTSGTGSEVTMNAIFGDEEQELKRGLISTTFLPDLAIIDPLLTISCPKRVTAASGVDAFTHAIESYVAVRATPLTKMYAEKAMKLFPLSIARAVHCGSDVEARTNMSWVSVLAGVSLANAGVGAVHALAYPLGGKYHIEHGVANALLMPYVFAVTGTSCTKEMVEVASFLQLGDYENQPHDAQDAVVQYLFSLLAKLNLPTRLKELGVEEDSLPEMAEQVMSIHRLLSNTPYSLREEEVLSIYQNAYHGVLKKS
ncbi:iron-containing alcohol dehydrogenase [Priestia abyssalis]|uniref:iron-containing alcohol dehydrogenase n=1 Tax=Priestia abyssalis TaxID=1221450 RepID=UPI0009954406|nr:iron-containing alcohol dehydrogenase [Priestia abyssalis]